MLFDTHVHLNAEQYEDDLSEVIERAIEAGVKKWLLLALIVLPLKRQWSLLKPMIFVCQCRLASG